MRVVISSGHGLHIRGASGSPVPPQLDEVDEARRVVDAVAEILRQADVEVETFHDDTSTTQNTNLETIVNFHNSRARDLDVSVHFNAYDGSAHGTEVLYRTQEGLADRVCDAICEAGGFVNRGPKLRTDLYFLNNTDVASILIETAFCDNDEDSERYRDAFDDICHAIAETIAGEIVYPIDEDDEEEEEPRETRVDIKGAAQGDVTVLLNGQVLRHRGYGRNVVALEIKAHGDVVVNINGQDFHTKPAIPDNHCKITATVFGGSDDVNYSAYGPYDDDGNGKLLDDEGLYCALPYRFEDDERPKVRVINRATGESATASIEDVGPWNIDDEAYVFGTARPQAESGVDEKGRETNGAGIDLSPALAEKIDIDGMGEVDWEFVE